MKSQQEYSEIGQRLIDLCKKYDDCDIYIHIHNYPDADAVASAYGLYCLLAERNINVKGIDYDRGVYRLALSRMIEYYNIPIVEEDSEYLPSDRIIVVDCQAGESNVTINGGKVIACFDHHATVNDTEYELFCHDIVGSCSTIIYNLYKAMGYEPSVSVGTGMLFGLQSDTSLLTKGVTDLDIDAFKDLRKIADEAAIRCFNESTMSVTDLKAFSSTLQNIRILSDLAMSYVPFDCIDGLIAALAEFILSVDDLNVVIVCSYREDGVKVSVRSIVPFIDAGMLVKKALAGIGDGGGHAHSAGGFIPKQNVDYDDMDSFFKSLLDRFIKEYTKCIMSE